MRNQRMAPRVVLGCCLFRETYPSFIEKSHGVLLRERSRGRVAETKTKLKANSQPFPHFFNGAL